MNKKKKSGKEKVSFAEKISKTLDIPPDILPGGSLIAIRGRNSVSVSGSSGITLYTPTQIKLSMHKGALAINGVRLTCTSYSAEELKIDGEIFSICFEED